MPDVLDNVVVLSAEEVAEAHQLAQVALAHWEATGRRGHYSNTINSHFMGKLGELGVEAWTRANGSWNGSPFRDVATTEAADVTTHARRVEVKSWDAPGWIPWGRCVRPNQVASLRDKADAIVWCSIEGAKERPGSREVRVTLQGWSTVDDVATCPIVLTGPADRQLENHQLGTEDLRALDTL